MRFQNAYEARLAHVLHLAALLTGQLENDVRVSINSNTANIPLADGSPDPGQLFGSPPDFLMTGRAWMLRLSATMAGGHVVTTSVTGNPTLAAPAGTYPALRVVSSCTEGLTQTMVVNRDAESPCPPTWPGGSTDHRAGHGLDGERCLCRVLQHPGRPAEISLHTVHARADHGVVSPTSSRTA